MIKKVLLLLVMLMIAGCGSSPEAIVETVISIVPVEITSVSEIEVTRIIENEMIVEIEVTRLVEKVITTTPFPTIRPTNTPKITLESEQERIVQSEVVWLEGHGWSDYIRRVNKLSFDSGVFSVDVTSSKYAQESVADVAWDIIVLKANGITSTEEENWLWVSEGDQQNGQFIFHLIVRDDAGRYRHESETTYDMFVSISRREIDHEEWETAANAGFR